MRRLIAVLTLFAGAGTLLAVTILEANAQARRGGPRTLTIKQRSFLDSGKYPPAGSMQRYVTNDTANYSPPYGHMGARYGMETLPGRFGPFSP